MKVISSNTNNDAPICSYDDSTDKTEVTLLFKREELLYDVRNAAYIEGHVMDTDNEHARHSTQDVGEDGNVDRVTRILSLSVAQCRELLYPYAKQEIYRTELDDKLREPEVYGIVINVPQKFSQTTLFLLEKLIHEYVVSKAVADWMSFTHPTKTEIWAQKADEMGREIRLSLHNRRGRVRRGIHPFG